MQPSANIMPRALLHASAPSASVRMMSNAVMILPEAITRMWSRRP